MKTPTYLTPIRLLLPDPRMASPPDCRPVEWGTLRVEEREFPAFLQAAAHVLSAQGRPGLYLRLLSLRGEMLAEFDPNQKAHIP